MTEDERNMILACIHIVKDLTHLTDEDCERYKKSLMQLYNSQVVPREAVAYGTFVPNFNGGYYKAGGGVKITNVR